MIVMIFFAGKNNRKRGPAALSQPFWRRAAQNLFPDRIYPGGIYDVNLKELYDGGVAGIIADMDNTLIEPGARQPGARMAEWIDAARDIGFDICLLSNSSRRRVVRISSGFGIYAVSSACKPAGAGFYKAMRLLGLGPSQVCVIGDQIFTDIYGAKRLGIMAIYTGPITKKEEPTIRLKRIPEKFILNHCSTVP